MKNAKNAFAKIIAVAALGASIATFGTTANADPEKEITPISAYEIPGSLIHSPTNIKWVPEGPSKTAKVVDSEGVPGGQAIQIRVKKKYTSEPWKIEMRAPFDKDISSGETLELYFWLRAAKTPKGQDAGKVDVMIGRNEEPYDTIIVHEIQPTTEWKMYKVSGVAGANFPAKESNMGFNLAKAKQTIEFGPFYAVKAADN